MRLEFYNTDFGLDWDIQENGFSLLGNKYTYEERAFGYFLDPVIVREQSDTIDHLPLTKEEASAWLVESGFIDGTISPYFAFPPTELRNICDNDPDRFPTKLSMLLSSRGSQSGFVRDYISNIREIERKAKALGLTPSLPLAPTIGIRETELA